jgi:small subunit ribosomal protein S16
VAVKIRLKRLGKIRSPHYRIVVADSRTKRDGRAIEEIGKYHPKNDPSVIEVNSERAQYWLSVGAQPTEAVVALLKLTGDWQKFSGDTSPSGVEPQKPKKNKTDAFNAALAESGNEPRSAATKPAKTAAPRKEAAAEATQLAAEKPAVEPAKAGEAEPAAEKAAKAEPAVKSAEASPALADDEIEGTPAEAQEAATAGVADAADPEV